MARSRRKTGDDATNARKRYYRSAERYLKQADATTGATSARYRQLAMIELDNALRTYSKGTTQKFSQPIQRLANNLGVSLEEERRKIEERSDEYAEKIREAAIDLEGKSAKSLVSERNDAEALRQAEAREILNSPIGHRILGGYVDVWLEGATVEREDGKTVIDNSKIIPILLDYFEVNNLADMLEKIEKIAGDELYADVDSDAKYEAVKMLLQSHVISDNTIVS